MLPYLCILSSLQVIQCTLPDGSAEVVKQFISLDLNVCLDDVVLLARFLLQFCEGFGIHLHGLVNEASGLNEFLNLCHNCSD